MVRYHATSEGNIPFTAEEEAARDAEEFLYERYVTKHKLTQSVRQEIPFVI